MKYMVSKITVSEFGGHACLNPYPCPKFLFQSELMKMRIRVRVHVRVQAHVRVRESVSDLTSVSELASMSENRYPSLGPYIRLQILALHTVYKSFNELI